MCLERQPQRRSSSGESIGIYYDDHFISVPKVESAIKDGSCVINGMSDYDEAEQLATFIRVGAINLKLEEMESSVAGAQLGGKALSSSVKAYHHRFDPCDAFHDLKLQLIRCGCIHWSCHLYNRNGSSDLSV